MTMPRMRILSPADQEMFEIPPDFNSVQRKQFFSFSKTLIDMAMSLRKPVNRIGSLR